MQAHPVHLLNDEQKQMYADAQAQLADRPPADIGGLVDFVPIIGDAKGIMEAVADPSAVNISAAAVGLIPGAGDLAGKGLKQLDNVGDAARGANTLEDGSTVFVDSAGNALPAPPGGSLTGSPDGTWLQTRNADGTMTGIRKDGAHSPNTHSDPRALGPHGHQPGVTNPDGTPWLPIHRTDEP